MRPSIVFIRHGESSANEQNLIGGHTDAGLTALGRQQALEAGRRIRAGGLTFDRVHTSTLRRAWETAELALTEAEQGDAATVRTPALAERDFGVFTGKNKHLIRKGYGYETYEACMNSPRMHLPQAESFQDMYARVADYYHRVLVPAAERGERLLVVAHKYVIELFALVVAGVPAEGYFDVRLPNSRPLNEEQLRAYAQDSSRLHKEMADRVVFHTTEGVALAAGAGILLRLLVQHPLEHIPFVLLSILLLGLISFFVMLGINSNHVLGRISLRDGYHRPWAVRIAASIGLVLLLRHSPWSYLFLLGLMPPALSSPALAVLWGGEQYSAVRKTIALSLVCAGITAALVAGLDPQVELSIGRVTDIQPDDGGRLTVHFQDDDCDSALTADLVVSNLPRQTDYTQVLSPLWRNLLHEQGLAMPHAITGKGVEVGPLGELKRADGTLSARLWVAGIPREGDEMVRNGRTGAFAFNVATIKNHSVSVAAHLLHRLEMRNHPALDEATDSERLQGRLADCVAGDHLGEWMEEIERFVECRVRFLALTTREEREASRNEEARIVARLEALPLCNEAERACLLHCIRVYVHTQAVDRMADVSVTPGQLRVLLGLGAPQYVRVRDTHS